MRKYLILAAALALLVAPGTARATTTLTTTCATTTLQYWTTASSPTHDGHLIQQRIQPHGSSAFDAYTSIYFDATHDHTFHAKRPQAQKVQYRVQLTNGGVVVEEDEGVVCDLSSTIHFAAGAEFDDCYESEQAGCGNDGEFARLHTELGGFGAGVETFSPSPLKGSRSYLCRAQTNGVSGDSNDRCERAMANASSVNIAPGNVWGNNQEVWYSLAFRLDGTPSCTASDAPGFDCGAVAQEKQNGMCGRPINSMAVSSDGSQLYLEQHNDDKITCSFSGDSRVFWQVPISANTWIRVLRHYKFSTSASTGYVETYLDADGDAFIDWDPVEADELHSDVGGAGLGVTSVAGPTDIGTINGAPGDQAARISTWTLKDNGCAGDPNQPNCETPASSTYCQFATKFPCAHARVGIYRDGDNTGTTTVNHDSVTSGTDSGDVVDVAF